MKGSLMVLLILTAGGAQIQHHGEPMYGSEAAVGQRDETPRGDVVRAVHTSVHGERAYRLYLPEKGASGSPLVVLLHGCTQDADDFARGTRMDALGEERGVAVLYPEQADGAHPQRCWNWYEPEHQQRDAGEPAILAGMIREVIEARDINPERVFVSGISAGGAMAATLIATWPELFSAAAVHSAVPYGTARGVGEALTMLSGESAMPAAALTERLAEAMMDAMGDRARLLPLLVIHGDEDAIVAPENGAAFMAQWRAVAERIPGGGPLRQTTAPTGDVSVEITTLRDGTGRIGFELWRILDLGHAWSGGAEDGTFTRPGGPDASRLILDFFLGGAPPSDAPPQPEAT